MERYFNLYPDDEARAIRHYQCNLQLAEAFYVSLSVFEVTLRNVLCRVEEIHQEMITVMGWMNRDVPEWLQQTDRFGTVCYQIRETMQWG